MRTLSYPQQTIIKLLKGTSSTEDLLNDFLAESPYLSESQFNQAINELASSNLIKITLNTIKPNPELGLLKKLITAEDEDFQDLSNHYSKY